jgi:hypothetical protein
MEEPMKSKKIITVAVVALVLFYIVSQPTQSAEGVQGIFAWLRGSAEAIITFLHSAFATS